MRKEKKERNAPAVPPTTIHPSLYFMYVNPKQYAMMSGTVNK